jgi:hypothetical protein
MAIMPSIVTNTVLTRVGNAEAAATTDINSTSVDMSLFEGVAFVVAFGTITATAVTSIKIQGSQDNSSWFDLADTAVTVADDDDNQIFVAEALAITYRYARCVVDRGTANAVVDGIIAIQTGPKYLPVAQPATTTTEVHFAPVAGTA